MKPNVIAGVFFGLFILAGVVMAINSPTVAAPTVENAVIEQTVTPVEPTGWVAPVIPVSNPCANGQCAITREKTVERKATVQRAAPVADRAAEPRKPVRNALKEFNKNRPKIFRRR